MAKLADCEFSLLQIYLNGEFSITNGDFSRWQILPTVLDSQIHLNQVQSVSIKSNSIQFSKVQSSQMQSKQIKSK